MRCVAFQRRFSRTTMGSKPSKQNTNNGRIAVREAKTEHNERRRDSHNIVNKREHAQTQLPVIEEELDEKELLVYEEKDFTPICDVDRVDDSVPIIATSISNTVDRDPHRIQSPPCPIVETPIEIDVPATLPGYRSPEPQVLSIDQIRPPITWYQAEEEEDEFNWLEVEEDIQEQDSGNIVSQYPKNYATPGSAITPRTVLINSPLSTGSLTNRPLITPSGRKISFMGQERTRNSITRGTSTASLRAVSIHGIPRRVAPKKGSLSFVTIDEHARSTRKEHLQTFTALTDYLKQPIRFHRLSELMTARVLIVWLANQQIKKSLMAQPDVTTPKGLLDLVARGIVSYSAAYAVLCREAGLQCVLIDGIARRTESLEIPDDESQFIADTWTAVYVEADWQIVHPFWICKGLHGVGGSLDDWIAQEVENEDRKDRANVIRRLKLLVKNFINEDFFMPTPEVFVHFNYADEIEWQLLPPEYSIRSRDDFLSLPFLFPAFYRFGLKLMTEPCCVLTSTNGKIKIWISAEWGNAHRITLTYDLQILTTECANAKVLLPDLDRMVIHCRHNDLFYFEIRFPIEGVFKLEIQGGYHRSHALRLCQFKLISQEIMPQFKYLPFNPFTLMWGPAARCSELGLALPSKPTGIVKVYPQQSQTPAPNSYHTPSPLRQPPTYKQRQFNFHLNTDIAKRMEYSVEMVGYVPDDNSAEVTPLDEFGHVVDKTKRKRKKGEVEPQKQDYVFCLECYTLLAKRQLITCVDIPHEGEFALIVKAVPFTIGDDKKTREYGEQVVACVYLLRTCDDVNRENVHQKLARAELQTTMQGNSPGNVFKALEKCHRVKINQHDDELAAGKTRAEYLEMRKAIFDAIHRRNFRVVNEQLSKVSKYRHKGALLYEIRRLFQLRKQLKRLLVFPKYIFELRRAGDELLYMSDPPPEVHITMGAMYLLLEEPDKCIESWSYIVQQLSNESIYRKMDLIADMSPSKNTRRKVMTLLAEYNYDRVNRQSAAAGKFYVWTQKVMGVFEDIDFDMDVEQKKENKEDNTKDLEMTATNHKQLAGAGGQKKHEVNVLTEDELKL